MASSPRKRTKHDPTCLWAPIRRLTSAVRSDVYFFSCSVVHQGIPGSSRCHDLQPDSSLEDSNKSTKSPVLAPKHQTSSVFRPDLKSQQWILQRPQSLRWGSRETMDLESFFRSESTESLSKLHGDDPMEQGFRVQQPHKLRHTISSLKL